MNVGLARHGAPQRQAAIFGGVASATIVGRHTQSSAFAHLYRSSDEHSRFFFKMCCSESVQIVNFEREDRSAMFSLSVSSKRWVKLFVLRGHHWRESFQTHRRLNTAVRLVQELFAAGHGSFELSLTKHRDDEQGRFGGARAPPPLARPQPLGHLRPPFQVAPALLDARGAVVAVR